jgi:hypothetical protein
MAQSVVSSLPVARPATMASAIEGFGGTKDNVQALRISQSDRGKIVNA